MPDIDSYALAHQLGLALGNVVCCAETDADREAWEAILAEVLDGRLLKLDPIEALEGFLRGLGTPEPLVDPLVEQSIEIPPLPPEQVDDLHAFAVAAARGVAQAVEQAQAAVRHWVDLLEKQSGRRYCHSVLPGLMAGMLVDIFGAGRDPGQVLDEAIASRFDVTGHGLKLRELQRVAMNARRRVGASPKLLTDLIAPWIAMAIARRGSDPSPSVVDLSARLGQVLFLDAPGNEDKVRIELGMYLGGLLGAVCLCPFQDRFGMDRTVDTWGADEIQQARDWALLMVHPVLDATKLPPLNDIKLLEPLRHVGWLRSTDFLMRLATLSKGMWFYEPDGEKSGLQDFLHELIREGALLAVWRSGGRYEVSPSDALGPNVVRHHNFGRYQNRSLRWDLAVSLNALSDEGYAGFRIETPIPCPELVEDTIEDALASQQWELAEALASLWVLHLLVIESYLERPNHVPVEFLARQRRTQPREYGYLGPTIRYLLILSRTDEFVSQGWTSDLEAASELFTAGEPENQDPQAITQSAVRVDLVTRLVGPVFWRLSISVKSRLVDAVLRRRLLAHEVKDGRLQHFGGDIVALVNPLESMLRDRFRTLTQESLGVLNTLFRSAHGRGMTLGLMINVLKTFPEFPVGLQGEMRALFPCLPLSRTAMDKLSKLVEFRNEGAHADVSRAEYDDAWNLLFSSSPQDAKENPGIYALLGRQFDG